MMCKNQEFPNIAAPSHRITTDSSGRIYLDNSPIPLIVRDGYNVRIGCTDVDLRAIENIYAALKTMGYMR